MVRNIIINCILLLVALAGSTIFYSCQDDVFFFEMNCSIHIFDKNSLIEQSSIELLAEVNANAMCMYPISDT